MRILSRVVAGAAIFIQLVVPIVVAAAVVMLRTGPVAGGGEGSPDSVLAAAAQQMSEATTVGGSGLSFDVVQTNTLYAKADGPKIELRDPSDPKTITGEADQFQVSTIFSHGGITADAFWMEMRGTQDPQADFSSAEFFARVLAQDGQLWRDDGAGWYATDVSPGVGIDPATARLLPAMLRSIDGAKATESIQLDGKVLQSISGTATADAYPGVIAADGVALAPKSFQVDCLLDDQGRLIRLEARVQNVAQTTYDLISDTVVTFSYEPPGDPPDPTPTQAPDPVPADANASNGVQP